MKRSGFTLVELLVIIGIIATMVTVAVVSIRQGQGAARQRGAARDVFAVIRHARSVALVSEEPSIITFSSSYKDSSVVSKIEIVASKKLSGSQNDTVQTIYGAYVRLNKPEEEKEIEKESNYDDFEDIGEEMVAEESKGLSVEDYLFETVSEDVLTDVRILVEMTGDGSDLVDDRGMKRSNISAFSNVDYLLGKYQQAKDEAQDSTEEDLFGSEFDDPLDTQEEPLPEPVKIVWQANGMCDPHRIWVYLDGAEKESGLVINVDMFGGVKVLTAEELMNLR
ncbi:MAG: type II secretion system protein [Kiritimatiellae bacterium]|nr:type II secretion system protein [Kiritimatiellia bacterium]